MTHLPSTVELRTSRDDAVTSRQSSDGPYSGLVTSVTVPSTDSPQHEPGDQLLLQEMGHRWSNDLQLVVGLLNLQSRRATNSEVRRALSEAAERVSILSHARRTMHRQQHNSLDVALRQVCDSFRMQAELQSISICLDITHDASGLSERQVTTLCLVTNELITNAIKHAFADGADGRIRISTGMSHGREVTVSIDDDGRPFAETAAAADSSGIGMQLVRQLMASVEGVIVFPATGTKLFELRVPIKPASEQPMPPLQDA